MHGQCNARPMVTFPDVELQFPLTRSSLYYLIEAHVCEQLAQQNGRLSNTQHVSCKTNVLTLNHYVHHDSLLA